MTTRQGIGFERACEEILLRWASVSLKEPFRYCAPGGNGWWSPEGLTRMGSAATDN